jgi:predicted RNA-binding protein associated with RNAse of E/G family
MAEIAVKGEVYLAINCNYPAIVFLNFFGRYLVFPNHDANNVPTHQFYYDVRFCVIFY